MDKRTRVHTSILETQEGHMPVYMCIGDGMYIRWNVGQMAIRLIVRCSNRISPPPPPLSVLPCVPAIIIIIIIIYLYSVQLQPGASHRRFYDVKSNKNVFRSRLKADRVRS